jgi:hypothetical protein
MWFSYLKIDTAAGALDHDLAIDPTGAGTPSRVAAGLVLPEQITQLAEGAPVWAWFAGLALVVGVLAGVNRLVGDPRDAGAR